MMMIVVVMVMVLAIVVVHMAGFAMCRVEEFRLQVGDAVQIEPMAA